jgi:hypothetical protein
MPVTTASVTRRPIRVFTASLYRAAAQHLYPDLQPGNRRSGAYVE